MPQQPPPIKPEGEPMGSSFKGFDNLTNPNQPQPFGRIEFDETPYNVDVKDLQSQFFPEGKHLKRTDGAEYIMDPTGRTIILFDKPTEKGFTSIYSPLTSQELRRQIARLPEENQQQLVELLHLPEVDQQEVRDAIDHSRNLTDILAALKRDWRSVASGTESTLETQGVSSSQQPHEQTPKREIRISSADLPEDHFLSLTLEEYQEKRKAQWESVKDLDDNDPRKIVYLRRFTEEFRSRVYFNPELTHASSEPYRYYVVDTNRIGELPAVEPYKPTLEVPEGKKVGIVIGYHHLEKPWGHLFMDKFQQQAQFDPNKIEFIIIENKDKPTGEESVASDREIQEAVRERGITHVIDAHEQLATLNHYMDGHDNPQFREPRKSGDMVEGEYTLDPFVPTWMIEQYYEGHTYPQLQFAVNDQIKKVEDLIRGIK